MSCDFLSCFFCSSKGSEEYIYTDCNHLVCLVCASLYWDKKYSIRCDNKTTFLEEDTCLCLENINRQQRNIKKQINQQSQLIQNADKFINPLELSKIAQIDNSLCVRRPRQIEDKLVQMDEKENKPDRVVVNDRQTELNLQRLQQVLNDNLKKIKQAFELSHKELERKEQSLLKSVYGKYSAHLKSIKDKINDQDIKDLNSKLAKIVSDEFMGVTLCQREVREDKILSKLEYNQQRMKEKINRHYDLLK